MSEKIELLSHLDVDKKPGINRFTVLDLHMSAENHTDYDFHNQDYIIALKELNRHKKKYRACYIPAIFNYG